MHRHTLTVATTAVIASAAVAAPIDSASAQQSDLSISPFVSFLPSVGTSPLAGLALTVAGNTGFGLRASAHLALENSNTGGFNVAGTMRPWGADADAMLFLGHHNGYARSISPFVFAGIGTAGRDSAGYNITRNNWSYGAGATVPMGSAIDLFGEARWRMSRYVLPTATLAPSPTTEFRFGLSFHVGSSGGSNSGSRRGRDRHMDVAATALPSTGGYPTATTSPTPASSSAAARVRVVGTAEDYIGAPYRFGGTSPTSGFDCSGFVQYVFAKQGVRLPRTAREQALVGSALSPDWRAVSAGDLVMFEENGRVSHVAIYAGHNRIIHSSSSGGGVRYDDLSTRRGEWFMDHMVAARRVTPDARGLFLDLARDFADGPGLQFDAPDHAPRPDR
ncbi:MAG: C40 family peptidase [bacterium]